MKHITDQDSECTQMNTAQYNNPVSILCHNFSCMKKAINNQSLIDYIRHKASATDKNFNQ